MSKPAAPRLLHVEHCMGTVFTIDVRGPGARGDAIEEVVRWLHRVDAVFSTYREGSDVSRLRRGAVALADCDPLVREVLDLCAEIGAATGGAFSARWRGGIDPTGLVKGWAVERAGSILGEHGSTDHAVNGGGDVQCAGHAGDGRPWQIGIVDPRDRGRVLAVLPITDGAVATSGTAERGAHIIDPFTHRPATGTSSVTVTGPSLTRADAYATAAFVMGAVPAVDWVGGVPGYAALTVAPDGRVRRSRGLPQSLADGPSIA